MYIGGLQKTTLLDFPDKLACIVFTRGCNFRCPYCYNTELISLPDSEEEENTDFFWNSWKAAKIFWTAYALPEENPFFKKTSRSLSGKYAKGDSR